MSNISLDLHGLRSLIVSSPYNRLLGYILQMGLFRPLLHTAASARFPRGRLTLWKSEPYGTDMADGDT